MTTTTTAPTTAAELRRGVGEYAARFDPALVTAVDAAGLVADLAEIEHIACYLKTVAAERVASTSVWRGS